MANLIILSIVENEIVKEFNIPIANMEACLHSADMAFCEAMAFLKKYRIVPDKLIHVEQKVPKEYGYASSESCKD